MTKAPDASNSHLYLGIDVQTGRGCPFAVLDGAGEPVEAGWASGNARQVAFALDGLAQQFVEARGGPQWGTSGGRS